MKKKYLKNIFVDNIYIKKTKLLISSSIFSRLITLISLPIITRIYDPDNFGVYTAFASIIAIINPISTFRYERAIVIAKNSKEEETIVFASIVFSIITSVLIFFGIIIIHNYFFKFRNFVEILIFFPFGSMLVGFYQPLYYLAVKRKKFKSISISKLIQSIGCFFTQIIFSSTGSIGLILGFIILNSSGFEFSLFKILKIKLKRFRKNILSIPKIVKKYKDFGFYLTLSSIIESLGNEFPKIIILNAFGQESLGFLGLSISLYNIPIFISNNSLGTFFIGNVNNLFLKNSLKNEIKQIIINLFVLGLIVCLITNLFAPYLVNLFLTEKWMPTINIIRIISPLFICELISSSINSAFYPSRKLKLSFSFQVLISSLKIIPLLVVVGLDYNFNMSLSIFVLGSCIGYIFQIYSMIKNSINYNKFLTNY
tara:strand:+ start:9749 stop:11026 length:1278 start_codon:yes stop_codon:yes gene_type:complete